MKKKGDSIDLRSLMSNLGEYQGCEVSKYFSDVPGGLAISAQGTCLLVTNKPSVIKNMLASPVGRAASESYTCKVCMELAISSK